MTTKKHLNSTLFCQIHIVPNAMKNFNLLIILVLSLAVLSGCSTKKIRSNPHVIERLGANQIEIDQDVETGIKENLRDDEEMRRFAHVNVNAYNGAVLLTGEAMNEAIKMKVIEMARIVNHVKMIHDNLIIDYPSDNLSREIGRAHV